MSKGKISRLNNLSDISAKKLLKEIDSHKEINKNYGVNGVTLPNDAVYKRYVLVAMRKAKTQYRLPTAINRINHAVDSLNVAYDELTQALNCISKMQSKYTEYKSLRSSSFCKDFRLDEVYLSTLAGTTEDINLALTDIRKLASKLDRPIRAAGELVSQIEDCAAPHVDKGNHINGTTNDYL